MFSKNTISFEINKVNRIQIEDWSMSAIENSSKIQFVNLSHRLFIKSNLDMFYHLFYSYIVYLEQLGCLLF